MNPKSKVMADDVSPSAQVGPNDKVKHGDWLVVKRKKSKAINAKHSRSDNKGNIGGGNNNG